ncbi:uncharacterized protein PAC_15812 [Phialocephala subalpina]|uniref:Uncharacterized protein n=1 Tax=Phialocephala subalpina TaxID=576137 RepID=A0A1L7XLK1_9HELO|nr:uncharacterized protein PAC_15812 [Phialocephala subalpina]
MEPKIQYNNGHIRVICLPGVSAPPEVHSGRGLAPKYNKIVRTPNTSPEHAAFTAPMGDASGEQPPEGLSSTDKLHRQRYATMDMAERMYEMSDISSADAGTDKYKRGSLPLDLGEEPPTQTSYSIRTREVRK